MGSRTLHIHMKIFLCKIGWYGRENADMSNVKGVITLLAENEKVLWKSQSAITYTVSKDYVKAVSDE